MTTLNEDSIVNVIHNEIKEGIRVALTNGCYASTVILVLSGMDTMAFLAMPDGQTETTRTDFIAWAEKYIHFPCKEQLAGIDLYGARCGMLHQHGVASKLSREGKCRMIAYMDRSVPEVIYKPHKEKDLVMVSIEALTEAFFKGVDA